MSAHGHRERRSSSSGLGRRGGRSGGVGGDDAGARRDERERRVVQAGVGDEALELGLERAEAARVRRLQLRQLLARHLRHPRPAARRRHVCPSPRARPPTGAHTARHGEAQRQRPATARTCKRRRERMRSETTPRHARRRREIECVRVGRTDGSMRFRLTRTGGGER